MTMNLNLKKSMKPNVGFSWAFAKNVSVIFAYDIYKEKTLAGNNTFTTQLDINFP